MIRPSFLGFALMAVLGTAPAQGAEEEVPDRAVDAFTAALVRAEVGQVREVVGERILRLVGTQDFEPSGAEEIVAASRGCRRVAADRVAGNSAVFLEFVCTGRSRENIEPEEDPGLIMRLWRHPSGSGLAVYYKEAGVQVRPPAGPKPVAPPPELSNRVSAD